MLTVVAVLAVSVALSGCASKMAYGRVKSALIDAGLSERNASCMADRMTDKLSMGQLRKLEAMRGEKRTLAEYVDAARHIDDPEIWSVTASSAALCAAGLAR